MNKFLRNLQNQPYETRVKILWATTAVVAIAVIVIWAVSFKSTVRNSGPVTLTPSTERVGVNQTETKLIKIERAEKTDGLLKLYFTINNDTDDILSFSKKEEVSLTTNNQQVLATSLLDRQGMPLVQKVLSKTQIFGMVTFPDSTDLNPTITFANMFFEKSSTSLLKQSEKLDLKTLETNSEVRN